MEIALWFKDLDHSFWEAKRESSEYHQLNAVFSQVFCGEGEDPTSGDRPLLILEGVKKNTFDWAYIWDYLQVRSELFASDEFKSLHFFSYFHRAQHDVHQVMDSEGLWIPDSDQRAVVADDNYIDGGTFCGLSFWRKGSDYSIWSEVLKRPGQTFFGWTPTYAPKDSFNPQQGALFLDRDGVINRDHGYIGSVERVEIFPEIFNLITWAAEREIPIVVVTNQSGVARGMFKLEDVQVVHQHISDAIYKETGVEILDWFVSPYHFEHGEGPWKYLSFSRKPGPGLFLLAARELGLSLNNSIMIGDRGGDRPQGIDLTALIQNNDQSDSTKSESFRNNSQWNNFAPLQQWSSHQELAGLVNKYINSSD